jgi:hypothetical protein
MKMDGDDELKSEELKKLGEALRRLEKERVFVPGKVDEAVLGAVAKHFADRRAEEVGITVKEEVVRFGFDRKKPSRVRRVRRWQRWLPLAASIAIAATMVQFARMGQIAPGDVNADGRVDVIDAMVLAQRVQSGETRRRWDVNGDRVVDTRDSEEIIARAVDLERGGS